MRIATPKILPKKVRRDFSVAEVIEGFKTQESLFSPTSWTWFCAGTKRVKNEDWSSSQILLIT